MKAFAQATKPSHRILPGFRLSLSYTLIYLTVLLAIPLAACLAKASSLTASQFLAAVWTDRCGPPIC